MSKLLKASLSPAKAGKNDNGIWLVMVVVCGAMASVALFLLVQAMS